MNSDAQIERHAVYFRDERPLEFKWATRLNQGPLVQVRPSQTWSRGVVPPFVDAMIFRALIWVPDFVLYLNRLIYVP